MRQSSQFTRREMLVALAGLAWSTACGRRPDGRPVAIAYGRDECAWCRMTIDDPTLAAQWITTASSPRIFGEPGCLLAWHAAHPETPGSAWVRTRDRDAWLRAEDALFVHDLVRTPMAFNLAAFAAPPAPAGATQTWSELLQKGAPDARPS